MNKIEAGVFEIEETEFKFNDLFKEVQSIFELQARNRGIELSFGIEEELRFLNITSDKQRIKQVILNIISNSLKFTDEGSVCVNLKFNKGERSIKRQKSSRELRRKSSVKFKVN